ncbi:alpha/beta hydrolase [Thermoanaerobacter sp. YS13]|uniref:alpha/beta hydrolase n=1 Tax=Thermoanaerobacter sp. YS13 TaxID=1511746 RepID=UPI000574AFD7|nr:alpha/beta hydrolase [Thermoanaerobacter sp. YS13]KHO62926.1 alpha/beta hydrolase [Thermoanaerobacter sp. YS13]
MQKHVEFTYNGKTLRGMMHLPDGIQGKVPMVAIFHGFTGNKMEPHFIFVKLSRQLEKVGIGSIRFDFYGSGESDGDFSEMTFSGELEDARQIIKFIKNEPMADVENIGILGLSMGGAVAGVIASELKEEIKVLVLWAPAFNMPELILEQSKSADEKMLGMLEREGIIDIGGLALSKEFIDDLIKLNIFELSKGYDKPVLIVHGTEDAAVKYEVSDKILEEVYKGNAKRITIEGADHTFNKLEWEKKAIEESINFFKENLKG